MDGADRRYRIPDLLFNKKDGTYKKLATVKGTAKKTYTTKNLEDGAYYFKVRAYKTVNKVSYYGAYSAVKSATIGETKASWDGVYSFEETDNGVTTGIILTLTTSGETLNYTLLRYEENKTNVTFEMYDSFNLSDEKSNTFSGCYVDMRQADAATLEADGTFSITRINSEKIKLKVKFASDSYSYILTK